MDGVPVYPTYSKSEPVGRHLWLHDVQNQEIIEVLIDKTLKNKAWRDLKLAPNKNSIIGGIGTPNNTLWLGELVKENEQWQLDYVKTLISNHVVISFWSPDSSKLAIKSLGESGSENNLQIIDLNSNQKVDIPFPSTVATVDWSPDSQSLIVSMYGAGTELPNPVYVVNANGSNLHPLGDFFFSHINWSPDGRYLGLFSSDDTNRNNPFFFGGVNEEFILRISDSIDCGFIHRLWQSPRQTGRDGYSGTSKGYRVGYPNIYLGNKYTNY